jgi:hypothetical protein
MTRQRFFPVSTFPARFPIFSFFVSIIFFPFVLHFMFVKDCKNHGTFGPQGTNVAYTLIRKQEIDRDFWLYDSLVKLAWQLDRPKDTFL